MAHGLIGSCTSTALMRWNARIMLLQVYRYVRIIHQLPLFYFYLSIEVLWLYFVWIKDTYALCRVFKKTEPGPKIVEHYGASHSHSQWITKDHRTTTITPTPTPTTIDVLSADTRRRSEEDDFRSFGMDPFQNGPCSSNVMIQGTSPPLVDGKWMQHDSCHNTQRCFSYSTPWKVNFQAIYIYIDRLL